MKKLLLLLLLSTPLAWATTNVTAHVVDSYGTTYVNCSYNVSWVGGGGSAIPTIGGVQGFQQVYDGAKCDSSANLAITLPDNNQISPTGSQWRFSICDQTKAYCFATTLTITGASQDISTALTAAAALLPQLAGGTVDTTSVQTIVGNKTFKTLNGIRSAAQFAGAGDIGLQINNAIADCPSPTYDGNTGTLSSGSGCDIYIPSGNYTLSTPVSYKSGIRIRGAGRGQTVIKLANAINKSMFLLGVNAAEDGVPGSPIGFVELRDVTIDGNAVNQSAASDCIHLGTVGRLHISNLQYQNCRNNGIALDNGNKTTPAQHSTVAGDGVILIENTYGWGPQTGGSNSNGIHLWGANDTTISRTDYNGNRASGNQWGLAIRNSGNITFEDSWIGGAPNFGVYVATSNFVRISGNYIADGSNVGLFIGESAVNLNSNFVTVVGNHVLNTWGAVPQIRVAACAHCRISGNSAFNATGSGIGTYGLTIDNSAQNADLEAWGNSFTPNATGTISDTNGWLNHTVGDNLKSGVAANTDLVGQVQLSGGGTATLTFTNSGRYTSAPICTCSSATAAHACWVGPVSTAAAVFNGTAADYINYHCLGRD